MKSSSLTSIILFRTSESSRVYLRAKKAISSALLATLVATIVIVIVIGAYATISTMSGSSDTSITCSESTATFVISQNGTEEGLSAPIPAQPCQHHISLSGFTLTTSTGSLTGSINVSTRTPLTTLILYLNGSYQLYNVFAQSGTSFSMQYNTGLTNSTLTIIAGLTYNVEFVALFKDGTATTANTTIIARH